MRVFLLAILFSGVYSSLLRSQEIPVLDFNNFEPYLHQESDSLYFINFWATWCVPCVKEMPAINSMASKYKDAPVKVLLVSMDMPKNIENRLIPFIKKEGLISEVIVLDDPDFNSWIDKVNQQWGGSLPATLIYSKNHRDFYEKSFEYEELIKIIENKLNEL